VSHVVFLDGVTGYLGRWTLFWLLQDTTDATVAVLIRPSEKGDKALASAQRRLMGVLEQIGMTHQAHRVQVIPGDLSAPFFGNRALVEAMRADAWLHVAGDVRFKKLGDPSLTKENRDHTIHFIETARQTKYPPRLFAHTSTFFVFEKSGTPDDTFYVPEEFHDPKLMEHHNAYGYSKMEAETYIHEQIRSGSLPFRVIILRPDIIMHHIPVPAIQVQKPGLLVDDYKVVFQLAAAILGKTEVKLKDGPSLDQPLRYIPCGPGTQMNVSDVDTVTRAMAWLTVLHGGRTADIGRYKIYNLVNRWHSIEVSHFRELFRKLKPEAADSVRYLPNEEFKRTIWPTLSFGEQIYYHNYIFPFEGYMDRPRTIPITQNVDEILGDDWHYLNPVHKVNFEQWITDGFRHAMQQNFGEKTPVLAPATT